MEKTILPVRKIIIQNYYKDGSMSYVVGTPAYDGYNVHSILETEDVGYKIFIEKDGEIVPWKSISIGCDVIAEYSLDFGDGKK